MNYTIVSLREYGGDFTMSLDKSGNKYVVSIHGSTSFEYKSRTFDKMEDAQEKFTTISGWCCGGLYSFSDRAAYLMK